MDDKGINLEIPRLDEPRISSLMTGRFIDDCEHVVLNANPDYLETFFKAGKKLRPAARAR